VSVNKFILKIFISENSPNGASDFIATFNEFIVNNSIKDSLIDVADYSHMHNGLGVLLTSHESNWSFDEQYGKKGLMVVDKGFSEKSFNDRFSSLLDEIIHICKTLEQTPRHKGLKFDFNTINFTVNDRSLTDSECEAAISEIKTIFETIVKNLYNCANISYQDNTDPAKRTGFDATIEGTLKD